MSKTRKLIVGILILMLVIQTIQPEHNSAEEPQVNDISNTYPISEEVHTIFKEKCYDCHSNNTRYPWYSYVQPIGWWLAAHIHEGKEELNFSVFKTYPEKKAIHKLTEVSEAVNEGWMPLDTYTWLHRDAEITAADREAINAWLKSLPVKLEEDH